MLKKILIPETYKTDFSSFSFSIFIWLILNYSEIMAKEKSPSKNSAKKEPVLSLKEKRAAKAAKKKNRS